MRKNLHNKILEREYKEQHLSTVYVMIIDRASLVHPRITQKIKCFF